MSQASHGYKILPYYTYADYCKWEGRWEIIEGIPYAMSPAPLPRHQRIASVINALFYFAIKEGGCKKCKTYEFLDIKVEEDTIVQPDLLIVCDEIKQSYLDFPPVLVVEIISPSTALKDRNNKLNVYQHFGIKYYLIIDPDQNSIEIFELNELNVYETILFDPNVPFNFSLDTDCIVKVKLAEVWDE